MEKYSHHYKTFKLNLINFVVKIIPFFLLQHLTAYLIPINFKLLFEKKKTKINVR